MKDRINLPGGWSLRKQKLSDKSEWALQFRGMDWIRICEFLPQQPPGRSLDDDIEKFASAMNDAMLVRTIEWMSEMRGMEIASEKMWTPSDNIITKGEVDGDD